MPDKPEVHAFFDPATCTVSYIVHQAEGSSAIIIDPVLDYQTAAGSVGHRSATALVDFLAANGLELKYILETHAHADHLSAGDWLREKTGARLVISSGITRSQKVFAPVFQFPADYPADGSEFDILLADGDSLELDDLTVSAMHTPGHTPGCITWLVGDAAFTGDTVFMPDFGTARTDFPGGDAATLYRSISRIHALAPETRLFVGHDYAPGGRAYAWETTVGESRANNIHVNDRISLEEFVLMRESRDRTLDPPALLYPSVQVNIRGGKLPDADANGRRHLLIPLTLQD